MHKRIGNPPSWRKGVPDRFRWECKRFISFLTITEISGAFGDIGTLFPIIAALSATNQISLTSSLFFGGLFNIITGLTYRIPMCVQPMKSIASIALVNPNTIGMGAIVSAGMQVSAIIFVLGATNAITFVYRLFPHAVIRGLQMATGILLAIKGTELISKSTTTKLFENFDILEQCVAVLCFSWVIFFWNSKKTSSALILFVLGLAFSLVLLFTKFPSLLPIPGIYAPLPDSGFVVPTGSEFADGFLRMALGQLPLTMLNSTIAVSKLADDLFNTSDLPDIDEDCKPKEVKKEIDTGDNGDTTTTAISISNLTLVQVAADHTNTNTQENTNTEKKLLNYKPIASVRSIAMSVGLMNLVGAWFGAMPFCHGSGGLAGQYRFGARSEVSVVLLGLFKMIVALVFGDSLLGILGKFPSSILGIMLVMSGVELACAARDVTVLAKGVTAKASKEKQDEMIKDRFVAFVVTVATIVSFRHDGLGVAFGLLTAILLGCSRGFEEGGMSGLKNTVGRWWVLDVRGGKKEV